MFSCHICPLALLFLLMRSKKKSEKGRKLERRMQLLQVIWCDMMVVRLWFCINWILHKIDLSIHNHSYHYQDTIIVAIQIQIQLNYILNLVTSVGECRTWHLKTIFFFFFRFACDAYIHFYLGADETLTAWLFKMKNFEVLD